MTAPVQNGLSELVLVVEDTDSACAFYRDAVGLTVERPSENGWAWLWTGEPENSPRLGLRAGPLGFGEHSPHPPESRWGPTHFAIRVDREQIYARLANVQEHGHEILGPTHFTWMGAQAWYVYDPDGNLLEFWVPDET